MKPVAILLSAVLLFCAAQAIPADRQKLNPGISKSLLRTMDPAQVDPGDLPLDPVSSLNVTGTPQDVDLASWRLTLSGSGLGSPTALGYEELLRLPTVTRRALLICPGWFADYAEWQGVTLAELLARAGASRSWSTITFVSMDGYREVFSREEVQSHLLFLALRVNGQVLPREHGFPVRLVAVDCYGGRWIKWIQEIHVE